MDEVRALYVGNKINKTIIHYTYTAHVCLGHIPSLHVRASGFENYFDENKDTTRKFDNKKTILNNINH